MSFLNFILFFCLEISARSGGAGGAGNSSSEFSSSDDLLLRLLIRIFFSSKLGAAFIIIIVIVYFLILRPAAKNTFVIRKPSSLQKINLLNKINSNNSFLAELDQKILIEKAKYAFISIQAAWAIKKIENVRRFITDGVYQRYVAQFKMMDCLNQTNLISNLLINQIEIVGINIDGDYHVVDLKISASSNDQFVSSTYSSLNSPGGEESFIEYWTFIRRKDCEIKFDIYLNENCPQCSAPLTAQLTQSARCPYCSTYLNNCEFDWVLSEVTQASDFVPHFEISNRLNIPFFSKQLLEDHASNALMQMISASSVEKPEQLKRFCSEQACKQAAILYPQHIVYNRLYLNAVDLIKVIIVKNNYVAELKLRYSSQKIKLVENEVKIFDSNIITQQKKMIMVKEISNEVAKGNIYANACSTCGATQKSSISSLCEYCGVVLNNRKHNWIVDSII